VSFSKSWQARIASRNFFFGGGSNFGEARTNFCGHWAAAYRYFMIFDSC